MKTATLHLDNIPGKAGHTRCYQLSELEQFGRVESEFVTVTIVPATAYQAAETMLLPSTDTGACLVSSLMRQPGSLVLHADYDANLPDKVEGAFAWALGSIGYTTAMEGA